MKAIKSCINCSDKSLMELGDSICDTCRKTIKNSEVKSLFILNLTQHSLTSEQKRANIIDPEGPDAEKIRKLMTFTTRSECLSGQVWSRAKEIAQIALKYKPILSRNEVMIGGAPFFMRMLEDALYQVGLTPLYSFSKRIVVEKDGKKISQFVFEGLIDAPRVG